MLQKSSTVNVMTPLIQIGVAPSKRGLKHVFSHFLLLYIFRVLLVFIKCDKCVHLWHQLFLYALQLDASSAFFIWRQLCAPPIFGQALPIYAWFLPQIQNFIEQLAPLDSVVNFERLSAGHGCDTSWPKLNLMLGDVSCIIWRFWPLPIHFTCTCGFLGPMRSTQVLYNLLKIIKVHRR